MLRRLDHVNLMSLRCAETIRFYTEVVGLTNGPFPGQGMGGMGAWLYDTTGRPVVHLVGVDPENPGVALGRLRERRGALAAPKDVSGLRGTGTIDHIAFECDDYDGMRAKLSDMGLIFQESDVPSVGLRQLFVNDPNDVTLELNFRTA